MNDEISFGQIVKERRRVLDLTQAELARRVACATITVRKIEADALRPSQQIAERMAMALNIPLEERARFVRLARMALRETPEPSPLPTPPPAPEEIGDKDLSGRAIRGYELGERIGTGGFGVVYRAVQPVIEREVAVKIILPQYADHPDFVRRFEAEARLVARLEHPYIVPLYDYWREPGVAYLVMRLLRGGSLHAMLQDGPLPLETVAVLLEQVGAALHAAHRVGVVHRDLKPANVLLDEDGNGYLADFGIAKNLSDPDLEDLTQAGAMIGSPAYSSPEQIRSEPVKPQADIYCLGVMLYELLTGHKPFDGPTPVDYIMQHLNEPLPPLDGHAALDAVIQRATAKDPLARYPDVPGLLAGFRQAVTGDSAVAVAMGTVPYRVAVDADDTELENPYKGLRPFGEADADDFFGRETLVQELLGRMAEADDPAAGARQDLARFLAVVGPSGSGKSSAVKAGLIPALRQGGLPNSEDWFIVDLMPGPHPLEELEAALLRIAVNPPESLLAQLRGDRRGLLRAARRVLPADPNVELVLVIDQFEEVFTQVADEAVRAHLLDSLVTAVLDERSRVRVVVTLRADFTGRALEYVDFGELVRQRTVFVLPLTPEELEQAVAGPAARAGVVVEPGLVATVVQDVGDQPGMLPLLQYALTELFERRERRTMTLAAYQESGGVTGALARRAEELYGGLDEAGQEAARQLFLRLVTLGEGVEDTRRRVLRTELEALTTDEGRQTKDEKRRTTDPTEVRPSSSVLRPPSVMDTVINQYGRYRLLTFDLDPATRTPTVEVAHEALLREWPRLRGWLESSRTDVHMQRLLAAATAEWEGAAREPSYLLRGARLAQFEGWAEGSALALTGDERAYLEASLTGRREREAEEEARQKRERGLERRARRVLQGLVGVLLGAAVIAGGLAIYAFIQRQDARRQASIGLAAQAILELEGPSPERAVPLALELLDSYPYTWQAERALGQAVLGNRLRLILQHEAQVKAAQWSPEGTRIVTGSEDGTVEVWDASTGKELLTISGHQAAVQSVAWSPSGDRILTASEDGTAKVWDASEPSLTYGEELFAIPGQGAVTNSAWWSPDGRRILTASGDGRAMIWDASASSPTYGEKLLSLLGHSASVQSAVWSPSGERILTVSEDSTARVWDATASSPTYGEELSIFFGHNEIVSTGMWSPDGLRIVTGSWEGTVKVWDPTTGAEILTITEHKADVYAVAWSPDGSRIVTGSYDGTAKVWDASASSPTYGREIITLLGHTSAVWGVAWSPSGDRIVTASLDGTAKVWDPDPTYLTTVGSPGVTLHKVVAWSPQGDRIARSFFGDRTLRVWDAAASSPTYGEELFRSHTNPLVYQVAWSPSGDRILTAEADGGLRMRDAASGELLAYSPYAAGRAESSPDGTRIVDVSFHGKTVEILDADMSGRPLIFFGDEKAVWDAAWSPDGTKIATAGGSGTARIWDADTGELIRDLYSEALGIDVSAVAWSPDGERIATYADDGIGRIWDVSASSPTYGQELVAFSGHTGRVMVLYWSPTGERILTASSDATVRVWDPIIGVELLRCPGSGAAWSPDGKRIASASTDGTTKVFPAWQTTQELIDHARECCVIRELTAEEREQFGLPPQ